MNLFFSILSISLSMDTEIHEDIVYTETSLGNDLFFIFCVEELYYIFTRKLSVKINGLLLDYVMIQCVNVLHQKWDRKSVETS